MEPEESLALLAWVPAPLLFYCLSSPLHPTRTLHGGPSLAQGASESGPNHVLVPPQVLISMVYLPETMPASFQAIYTPVESAGTEAQIKHLARLMATQMTAAGLGPGVCPLGDPSPLVVVVQ